MAVISFSDIPLDKIKGVLIDLDDTLYDYKSVHPLAIEKCYIEVKDRLDLTLEEFSNLYRSQRTAVTEHLKPAGTCRSRLLAFQRVFEQLDFERPYLLAQSQTETYWRELIAAAKVPKQALDFLKRCRRQTLKTCLVTDMLARIQILKLEHLGLIPYIDQIVTSEEAGAEKPAPVMFELALDKLDLRRNEVIMVGDSESKDIAGAKALGIRSFQVRLG